MIITILVAIDFVHVVVAGRVMAIEFFGIIAIAIVVGCIHVFLEVARDRKVNEEAVEGGVGRNLDGQVVVGCLAFRMVHVHSRY